ncbi:PLASMODESMATA CALLOSE-BINDING PROTEIN 2-like [Tasmannia lanceolata]|uniref:PLASMODESMATA CALLOSE-BINDING PROTEIN 2-like n=1 Tax=Tasmannia lanceolata TaxID=3420 RepID=UPI0040643113
MGCALVGVVRAQAVRRVVLLLLIALVGNVEASNWCVCRSNVTEKALQTALDYACWAGADCTPIQANGLCYLPNTLQAHASYAFNSYYQRKAMAPGSCDFSGTASVSMTDPSYGSCVYPSSPSNAGGLVMTPPNTPIPNTPNTPVTTGIGGGGNGTGVGGGTIGGGNGVGGFTPLGPTVPDNNSKAYSLKFCALPFCLIFLLPLLFTPI